MTIHNSLAELIGNTPLVKLNHIPQAAGVKATIAVKVEYFNPGGSSKDRIAERIIDAAEQSGQLKPGGVIVEPTSGNTGVGLALVAQQRGYRTIFTLPDKVSESKRAVLRAYGAEVIVTPTDAGPDDPRSYYQVAERLANTIPGGFRPNQYDNPNGPLSHYYTTGPEIWEATDHKVTHFVAGIGTGGTISGNKATQSSNDAGGGAIYMRGNGKINISGSAKINSNTASRWGGAICLRQDSNQSTTLNMRGGEISGNRATKEGGAVHVLDKDCMFYLYDGKITGNTSGDGGAIYLNQEPSWLIMQGGEISGNTATGNGGGVYIYRTGSVCQLYSGKIENNKASGNGGGIYINPSNSGQLRVGNKPLVQNNTVSGKANNVYLPSGKTLTIGIGMSTGAAMINTSAVIYTRDIYNKFINTAATQAELLRQSRLSTLVVGGISIGVAIIFQDVFGLMIYMFKLWPSAILPPLMCGLLWGKISPYAGAPAVIAGGLSFFLWSDKVLGEPFGIPANFIGIGMNCLVLFFVHQKMKGHKPEGPFLPDLN